VLWPFVSAFQVLSEDGLPVGVVNDLQLEEGELAGYRVLVLPKSERLSAVGSRVAVPSNRRSCPP
jgi:sporulation protein YlmC with PRC-barrel domain